MRLRQLNTEQLVPRPLPEVFAFFSDAHHLNALTPPWLGFRILTPAPIVMGPGTLIDYQLRLFRIPVRWRTEITVWEPPSRFVDVQIRGPYRQWVHEHIFEERADGTMVNDRVDYAVPGSVLEPLIHRWFVARQLQAIFRHRRERLADIFTPNCG